LNNLFGKHKIIIFLKKSKETKIREFRLIYTAINCYRVF
jgi:hypothetical protein